MLLSLFSPSISSTSVMALFFSFFVGLIFCFTGTQFLNIKNNLIKIIVVTISLNIVWQVGTFIFFFTGPSNAGLIVGSTLMTVFFVIVIRGVAKLRYFEYLYVLYSTLLTGALIYLFDLEKKFNLSGWIPYPTKEGKNAILIIMLSWQILMIYCLIKAIKKQKTEPLIVINDNQNEYIAQPSIEKTVATKYQYSLEKILRKLITWIVPASVIIGTLYLGWNTWFN